MDKHENLPSTHSLLEKLTVHIAGINEDYKRKLTFKPLLTENKFIREPLDVDKELIELEKLIKNLQNEITQMTKNANKPMSEYLPKHEEVNKTTEMKHSKNIFDSLPTISLDDVELTFKSLWNGSSSGTTSRSNTPELKVSDELKDELRKEIFGDPNFVNSLTNAINEDLKQNAEAKNYSRESVTDNVTDKKPALFEENVDNFKNNNIKTGLIMRIFGSNNNNNNTNNLNSSANQKINDSSITNKCKPEVITANSSLDTESNIRKSDDDQSVDATKGTVKSLPNNTTSKIKLNPHTDTSNENLKTPSIMNLLSKIEHSVVNTIMGTNKKSVPLTINNIYPEKPDENINMKQSIENVMNVQKNFDSKTDDKDNRTVNIINIYIDTPKSASHDSIPTENKPSLTKVHEMPSTKTSSTSMTRNNFSNTQQTFSTDSVLNDDAFQDAVNQSNKYLVLIDSINKDNSKFSGIGHNSSEPFNTRVQQSIIRTITSDPSVFKPQGGSDRPLQCINSKDREIETNTDWLPTKNSNTSKRSASNSSNKHSNNNKKPSHQGNDCLNDDNIPNNQDSQMEKPIIVIQFSEDPDIINKEIIVTKPSVSNTFKVYTNSNEEISKAFSIVALQNDINNQNKTDFYHTVTVNIAKDTSEPAFIGRMEETISENENLTDVCDSLTNDDDIQSNLVDGTRNQPGLINSTLITVNNIDTSSDVFEDSQDFTQEPAAGQNTTKPKND